jgi:hypothetical protein
MTTRTQSTKNTAAKGKARTAPPPEQEGEIRARVDAQSAIAHPLAMEMWTHVYGLYLENADALKLAQRVAEIYAATDSDGRNCTAGGRFIMEAADAVTGAAGECVTLQSPLSKYFVPFFIAAVRGLHPDYVHLKEIKAVVARVDAGEDIEAIAEQEGVSM